MAWESKRLDEIAMIQTGPFGSQLHKKDYVDVGTPIITVEHLGQYRIRRQNMPMVTNEDANRLQKYSLLPGDIVFSRVGSVDQSSYVGKAESGWLFSGRCLRVRPDANKADPLFTYYALNTAGLKSYIRAIAVGATMPSINTAILSEVPISLPPLNEQQRIATVLGSLDDKIAANQHILKIVNETIQAAWSHAAAASSAYVKLEEVIDINPRTVAPKGATLKTLEMKNLPEVGFSVDEWIDREAKSGSRYQNGDTLLARITPCFENGKCGYVDFLETGAVGAGSTEFIVLRPQQGVPSAVPYVIARSADFRTFAAQTMTGTSGRQRVQHRGLKAYETVWPTSDSLTDFDSKTSPLLELAAKLRDENRVLANTRDELLPLLMNGKISVREAEQEATSAGADIPSEEIEA